MAKKKHVSKSAKKRLLFFGTLSFAMIIYFFITLTTYTLNIIDLNYEKKELQKQLLVLKEDEENLNIELKKLQDPDYIARFARENYLYSKNGEYIIKIQDNKKTEKKTTIDHKESIRNMIIGVGVFLSILGVYVLRHMTK